MYINLKLFLAIVEPQELSAIRPLAEIASMTQSLPFQNLTPSMPNFSTFALPKSIAKSRKTCAACKKANCSYIEHCPGSGNRACCICVKDNHHSAVD